MSPLWFSVHIHIWAHSHTHTHIHTNVRPFKVISFSLFELVIFWKDFCFYPGVMQRWKLSDVIQLIILNCQGLSVPRLQRASSGLRCTYWQVMAVPLIVRFKPLCPKESDLLWSLCVFCFTLSFSVCSSLWLCCSPVYLSDCLGKAANEGKCLEVSLHLALLLACCDTFTAFSERRLWFPPSSKTPSTICCH